MRSRWLIAGALLAVPTGAAADCEPGCATDLCTQRKGPVWGAARAEAISDREVRLVEVVGPAAEQLSPGDVVGSDVERFAATGPVLVSLRQRFDGTIVVHGQFPIDEQDRATCDATVDVDVLLAATRAESCIAEALDLGFDDGSGCDDMSKFVSCSASGGGASWLALGGALALALRRRGGRR